MGRIKWFGHGEPPVAPDEKVRVWIYMGVDKEDEAVGCDWSWHWEGDPIIGCITAYEKLNQPSEARYFETGATRSADTGKYDYEGYLSPLVLERFAQYMTEHRKQADGKLRDSDNWQKGIPKSSYMKSGWRHFVDWWKHHRGHHIEYGIEETICALIFNAQGYLHEHLKEKNGKT